MCMMLFNFSCSVFIFGNRVNVLAAAIRPSPEIQRNAAPVCWVVGFGFKELQPRCRQLWMQWSLLHPSPLLSQRMQSHLGSSKSTSCIRTNLSSWAQLFCQLPHRARCGEVAGTHWEKWTRLWQLSLQPALQSWACTTGTDGVSSAC